MRIYHAVLALYRPGPMESGMLDDFIDRKHGRAEINYFYDEFDAPFDQFLKQLMELLFIKSKLCKSYKLLVVSHLEVPT